MYPSAEKLQSSSFPLLRGFLLWSTIGGTVWGIYTGLLAYWVGNALSGYPLTSFLLAGGITTALIAVIFVVERRRSRHHVPGDGDAPASA